MREPRWRAGASVAIIAAALAVSACGGDNSGSATTNPGGTSRAAAANGAESRTTATTGAAGVGTTAAASTRTLAKLPDMGIVYPGTYTTARFTPSFSVKIDQQGWVVRGASSPERLGLVRADSGAGIAFVDVRQVRDAGKPGRVKVAPAPDDLLGWFQKHPYLKTGKPQPVSVGGVSGKQFDASVSSLPEKGFAGCSAVCLPLFHISSAEERFRSVNLLKGEKSQVIVVNVKGEEVAILVFAPAHQFEGFLPEAEKVLDTIEWRG